MSADLFAERLAENAASASARLESLLASRPLDNEIERPRRLLAAMRHGVLNGGKRLRPFLVMESARLYEADSEAALDVAAALECIHCYSLIHDDLPAMDDDDMRRGQPTVHKAYDEATAILAGDALLTLAFDIVASCEAPLPDRVRTRLVSELARSSGIGGMAGGQMLDLQAEKSPPDEDGIIRLQAMKTGALIRFACRAGPLLAGASSAEVERMSAFGEAIGLAFQIADDLLDLTADAGTLGKATGKDAAAGKASLVLRRGPDWARTQLAALVREAHDLLEPLGAPANVLREAAEYVISRRN